MKYHKIPGVDKAVCTAEQMIAYNMAFSMKGSIYKKYRALPTAIAKSEVVQQAVRLALDLYRKSYTYNPGKYDEDAIFSALNAGLADYLENPFIANDYETIGKAFPAHYLNEKKPA